MAIELLNSKSGLDKNVSGVVWTCVLFIVCITCYDLLSGLVLWFVIMVDQPFVSPKTSIPTGTIKYIISNHNMQLNF